MNRIDVNGLKMVQMDLLTEIDKFCDDNNIRYSISDGTLLGAIRHGGFIPWDDDIDISMPREDYELFETVFPSLYKGYIQLNSIKRTPGWKRSYAVITDERTILYEDSNEDVRGIGIDLFPVDDVPDSDVEWRKYFRKLKRISFMHNIKLIIWKKERGIIKNMILILLKILISPIPTKYLTQKCDIIAKENNSKGYQHCYQSSFGVYGPRPFSKSVLQEFISIKFEDRTYKCYKNYDNYLANTYGDYMTPPPISAQVSTHDFEAYWRE